MNLVAVGIGLLIAWEFLGGKERFSPNRNPTIPQTPNNPPPVNNPPPATYNPPPAGSGGGADVGQIIDAISGAATGAINLYKDLNKSQGAGSNPVGTQDGYTDPPPDDYDYEYMDDYGSDNMSDYDYYADNTEFDYEY